MALCSTTPPTKEKCYMLLVAEYDLNLSTIYSNGLDVTLKGEVPLMVL